MIGRRKFLALLGIGTASAPLAAKAAADAEILALTNFRYTSALASGNAMPGTNVPQAQDLAASQKATNYLSLMGRVPDFVECEARASASYVSSLDPDIACKRSWSMCVKIQEQRKRNYDRIMERWRTMGPQDAARQKFKQTMGFDWPW